jgi:hypothetical protein
MTKSVVAFFAAAAIAGAAHAQALGPFEVYDSHGTLVGQLLDSYSVARQVEDQVYQLYTYRGALIADANFYFQSGDCSGQPYLFAEIPNEVPLMHVAWYQAVSGKFASSGKILWATDGSTPQLRQLQSWWSQELDAATGQVSPACETFTGVAD